MRLIASIQIIGIARIIGIVLTQEHVNPKRKTTINFEEPNKSGPLFFSARRSIMQQSGDLMQHNSGAYNTVGRHGAGFSLKP